MIRSRCVLVSLLVVLTLTTAAKAVDKEKLRQAVFTPQISIIIGYRVSWRGGFEAMADELPEPGKIAGIEGELKGDATDAERYIRLAQIYLRGKQPAKVKEARLKAVTLFRKQLEQHRDDIASQLRLADTLDLIEKSEEAEALVRRVLKDHPTEWHAWLVLGDILEGKSWQAIMGSKPYHWTGPETLLRSIRAAQPTQENIATSHQYRQEAVACFDRAVSLAPGESEVYRRRGAVRWGHGCLDHALRLYKGEKLDFSEFFLGREALPDLRRAVDMNRQEYKGIGFVVVWELMTEIQDRNLQGSPAKQSRNLIEEVSEPTRNRFLEDMKCLEKGTQSLDKCKAAEAAEVLGFIQFLLFADKSAAEMNARRSIELDPKRETAWDLLFNCLAEAEEYQKMAAVCRERLAHKDSTRNRLWLVKAYDYLYQLDKAEEVVKAGLQREPEDFMLRLTLADLLLMRGDKESLHQAGQLFAKLDKEKISYEGCEHRWSNFAFASGIYCGLIGERELAQKWLKAVQKYKPEYPEINDALKALEE